MACSGMQCICFNHPMLSLPGGHQEPEPTWPSLLVQVAGLIGGPGLFPGVNVGEGVAVFEQGARHVAKDIAGQGVANPSAGLLAAAMMLRHLNLPGFSDRWALLPQL